MALIKCPECSREISSKANTCPNCAYPIAGSKSKSLKGVRTVEQTSKHWKFIQMISVIILFFGIISIFQIDLESEEANPWPAALTVIGLCGYIAGRIGAWWDHG